MPTNHEVFISVSLKNFKLMSCPIINYGFVGLTNGMLINIEILKRIKWIFLF